jgi:hypothetical protein
MVRPIFKPQFARVISIMLGVIASLSFVSNLSAQTHWTKLIKGNFLLGLDGTIYADSGHGSLMSTDHGNNWSVFPKIEMVDSSGQLYRFVGDSISSSNDKGVTWKSWLRSPTIHDYGEFLEASRDYIFIVDGVGGIWTSYHRDTALKERHIEALPNTLVNHSVLTDNVLAIELNSSGLSNNGVTYLFGDSTSVFIDWQFPGIQLLVLEGSQKFGGSDAYGNWYLALLGSREGVGVFNYYYARSSDRGQHWTVVDSVHAYGGAPQLFQLPNNRLLRILASDSTQISVDGTNWSTVGLAPGNYTTTCVYDQQHRIFASINDTIYRSDDLKGVVQTSSGSADHVYPQPANNSLVIQIEGNAGSEILFFDARGEQLFIPNKLRGGNLTVDVSKLSAGTYFYRVAGNAATAGKFVIVR